MIEQLKTQLPRSGCTPKPRVAGFAAHPGETGGCIAVTPKALHNSLLVESRGVCETPLGFGFGRFAYPGCAGRRCPKLSTGVLDIYGRGKMGKASLTVPLRSPPSYLLRKILHRGFAQYVDIGGVFLS